MQREEPRLGGSDISETDISRGDRRTIPTPNRDAHLQLWWQIALGGFLALLLHSVVVGTFERWETQQALKAMNAEMARLNETMRTPAPVVRRAPPPAPLRAGERCVKGERFERVENGWVHLPHQPCQ